MLGDEKHWHGSAGIPACMACRSKEAGRMPALPGLSSLRQFSSGTCEHAIDHWLEVRKGKRVVFRIERGLIPSVGEHASHLVPRLARVFMPRIRVFTHQRVIMPTLKILVSSDDLVGFVRDVRLENLCRDCRVVFYRNDFTNVVTQCRDNHLFGSPLAKRAGRGLQAVMELVHKRWPRSPGRRQRIRKARRQVHGLQLRGDHNLTTFYFGFDQFLCKILFNPYQNLAAINSDVAAENLSIT